VAGRIKIGKGASGYVEYGIARRTGLTLAWHENKAGQIIQSHGGSGLATLLTIQIPENFRASAPNPDGEDAYPIVTYSWLLVYRRYDTPESASHYFPSPSGRGRGEGRAGPEDALTVSQLPYAHLKTAIGFVRLPPRIATRAVHAVSGI
jgi:hypothetical protein